MTRALTLLLCFAACSPTRTQTPPEPESDASTSGDLTLPVQDAWPGLDVPPAGDLVQSDVATPFQDAIAEGDAVEETPDVANDDVEPPIDAGEPPAPKLTLQALQAAIDAEDFGALKTLMLLYDMPVCDGSQCLFVTQSDAAAVELLGDFNGWTDGTSMTALGTWFWAPVELSPSTVTESTVTEYKLKLDGEWALDPQNAYFRFGSFGPNSAVYPADAGRLTAIHGLVSPQLGNSRSLYVYLPAAYFQSGDQDFPVLYMQDGFNIFTNPAAGFGSWDVDQTADALFATGKAQSVIIVGIDTSARLDEYTHTKIEEAGFDNTPKLPQYADFLVETVKPLIDDTFRTSSLAGIAGSSLGGISSLWIGWHHADTFGVIGSFSGSYWLGEGTPQSMRALITANAAGNTPDDLRVYIDSGDSSFSGEVSYWSDSWAYSDWTRNALIGLGWSNHPGWDTDADLTSPPENLSGDTAPGNVPALVWTDELAVSNGNLLSVVGPGHMHNEAAWKARFGLALRFMFPAP